MNDNPTDAMPYLKNPDRKGRAERGLLAALCQGSLSAPARETVLRRLAQHSFSGREYEVIFQAVSKLPTGRFEGTREAAQEALMASLTRLGFPDIDLAPFFTTSAPAENDLSDLLEEL